MNPVSIVESGKFSRESKSKFLTDRGIMFREKVYEIVASVPQGKVVTYGQVARLAGKEGAARAVGLFMKNNPDQSHIPCHRVVASDGSLAGYAFGSVALRKRMLEKEGVAFQGDRVDLEQSLWDV